MSSMYLVGAILAVLLLVVICGISVFSVGYNIGYSNGNYHGYSEGNNNRKYNEMMENK